MHKKAAKPRDVVKKKKPSVVADKNPANQVEDSFDTEKVVDNSSDICAFCKEGHEFGLMLRRQYFSGIAGIDIDESSDEDENDTKDVEGVWVSKYSLTKGPRRLFAHYICALRSPIVRKNGKVWYNVRKEIARTAGLVCSKCNKRGASIGCFEPKCGVVMHYHCAVTVGYCYYRFKDKFFLCGEHKKQEQDKEAAQDAHALQDISGGRETIRVDFENQLDGAHPLDDDWRYVSRNLDSDDVITNSRSIHDLPCCSCQDLCDDVNVCECLSNGKNYNYRGELVPYPQPTRLIVECNIRCCCSIRRCTNRVVQRGLTKRLQVFRVKGNAASARGQLLSPPSKVSAVSQWAVRALDRISVHGFVCEMVGQFVLQDTNDAKTGLHLVSQWRRNDRRPKQLAKEDVTTELFAQDDQSLSEFFNGRLCIDVRRFGNVATFIRDSRVHPELEPNLLMVRVHDRKEGGFVRLALFAAREIEAGSELIL